MFWKEE